MARRARAQRDEPLIEPISLRPKEAAMALGISERLLREWTQKEDIPHVKVGNVLLYPVAEIRTWLGSRAMSGPGATAT